MKQFILQCVERGQLKENGRGGRMYLQISLLHVSHQLTHCTTQTPCGCKWQLHQKFSLETSFWRNQAINSIESVSHSDIQKISLLSCKRRQQRMLTEKASLWFQDKRSSDGQRCLLTLKTLGRWMRPMRERKPPYDQPWMATRLRSTKLNFSATYCSPSTWSSISTWPWRGKKTD